MKQAVPIASTSTVISMLRRSGDANAQRAFEYMASRAPIFEAGEAMQAMQGTKAMAWADLGAEFGAEQQPAAHRTFLPMPPSEQPLGIGRWERKASMASAPHPPDAKRVPSYGDRWERRLAFEKKKVEEWWKGLPNEAKLASDSL